MVEEVEVDAVGVVLGTYWCDGSKGRAGFLPRAAGHATGVVDQEDGVEGGEEGIGVVGGGGDGWLVGRWGLRGSWAPGGCCGARARVRLWGRRAGVVCWCGAGRERVVGVWGVFGRHG